MEVQITIKLSGKLQNKLVAEFVTAIATNDNSRIETLTKVKQSFIQRWIAKLMTWLGLGMRNNTSLS